MEYIMRNIGLDLLRILAVLLVIGRHLHLPEDSSEFVKACVGGGWVGVDLFFVLSGFLVSSLLFREYQKYGSVNIKRFLIRRGFKIYPAFWLFLISSLIMYWCLGIQLNSVQVLGELTFLQNYLGGIWAHTWSLAVEEHFYIGLALLVTFLIAADPNKPFRRIPYFFVIIAVTCLSFRVVNLIMIPEYSHQVSLMPTHLRIDSLMFGVLLSYLWNFHEFEKRTAQFPSWLLVVLASVLLSPAFVFQLESDRWISVVGFVFFYLGSGLLIIAAVRMKSTESKVIQGLAALGAASYSIYLWHVPVATLGYRYFSKATGIESYSVYLLIAVVGACLFGWVLNRIIENPVLCMRDRLFPTHSNAMTMPAADVVVAVPQIKNGAQLPADGLAT